MMGKELLTKAVTANKKLCPFLGEPFDYCYCVKMNSQYVERAVYYCGNNFKSCEIYRYVSENGNGDGLNIEV